jgi:hypothetical protein
VSYYNTNGDCQVTRDFATAEGRILGNWVHDQRKRIKNGVLSDDIINLLSDLQFDFSMQMNVVGAKLRVSVAISNIFKHKKEYEHISVPNKEPHKQPRRWIIHAKAVSKKIIEQGSGNPNFTLPNLKLLNELGIIKLPSNFKLKETTITKSAKKKEKTKKMTKVPPKAKAQGARSTVSRVTVVAAKKNITAPRPKANTPIQPKIKLKMAPKKIISAPRAKAKASTEQKKILKTPLTSTQVSSQPTHTSSRRAATAINMSHQQGTSFHSVHNNPFSKLESMPVQMYPLSSSLLLAGNGSNVESDPSEFPSPQTKSTFNLLKGLAHSSDTANPHASPDTVNHMESAHPNQIRPSPPISAASPTLLDKKVAAATGLVAVATTHIPLELPFTSVGVRTRQRSQASSQVTMEPRTVAACMITYIRPRFRSNL